ncbi:hypothetical protein ABZ871_40045 [Streptomyces populi]
MEERNRRLHDQRIEAYAAYISTTRILNGELWKLFDELTARAGSCETWTACLLEMHRCWTDLSTAAARVNMLGPNEVAVEADKLHNSMRTWHVLCAEWARAAIHAGHPPQGTHEIHFRAAADAKRIRISSFQQATRHALNTTT